MQQRISDRSVSGRARRQGASLAAVLAGVVGAVLAASAAAKPPVPATPVPAPAPERTRPALPPPPPGVNIPPFQMFNKPLPMIIRSTIREATGRLDKLAFDPGTYRVFVSGTKAGVVYVLDLATHQTPHIIQNLPEPRGLIWQVEMSRLIVACGGDGTLRTFRAKGKDEAVNNPVYDPEHVVRLSGEATDLALETPESGGAATRVWVAHAMMLSAVDLERGERVARVSLPGRPDGIAFVRTPSGPRVFVNVPKPEPTEAQLQPRPLVVVVDPAKGEIVERWSISDTGGNTAITANDTGDRVFVVTQEPPRLLVLDSVNGREIARLEAPADADDAWFDTELQRVYVPGGGGGGQVAVVQSDRSVAGAERYAVIHLERTNVGCRSAVLSERERLLLVASPAFGTDPTFIYVYMVGPR